MLETLATEFIHADNLDDWDAALEIGERAVVLHPNNAYAWAMRARAHLKNGNSAACDHDITEALRLDPDCGLAIACEAARLGEMQQHTAALKCLDAAIKRLPPDAALHIARGWIRADANDHQGALSDYQRAAELNPASTRGLVNAAHSLMRLERHMEAANFLDQAAHQAPDYGMLAYNAGTMLYEVDEFDRAIVHLDRARELLGEQNAVQMNRALTLQQMGRHQDAIDEWLILYQREPDWDWVLKGLGKSYYRLGHLSKAQYYFSELDALDGDVTGAIAYGWLLFHDRNSEALIALVEPYLQQQPLHPEFGQMMGMSLYRLQRNDKALEWMERITAANEDYHYVRGDLANVLSSAFGRHQDALEHIQIAMTQAPENTFYQRVHSEIRERLNHAPKVVTSKRGWLKRLFGG